MQSEKCGVKIYPTLVLQGLRVRLSTLKRKQVSEVRRKEQECVCEYVGQSKNIRIRDVIVYTRILIVSLSYIVIVYTRTRYIYENIYEKFFKCIFQILLVFLLEKYMKH